MATENPYQPALDVAAVDPFESVRRDYGGIGRAQYFLAGLALGIAQNVINLLIAPRMPETLAAPVVLLVALLAMAGTVALAGYRMVNQGSSGWWGLGILVPLLNLYVGLRCLLCPEGYSDHKTLDSAAKVIAGVFLGFVVLMVLIVVLAGTA